MIAAKEATPLPLSRADKRNRSRDTFLCPSSAHHHDTISKNRRAPVAKRERSAERRMPTIAAMQTSAPFARASAFGAAVRQFGARPPSGATLRHSPGRTHPPLAQLQFPRFLRPDLASVTRFDLSRVYRAPRRPVVMPVERWPRAARGRMAYPPAGTAPAPLFRHAFRKGALNERGGEVRN
jgi:hypothetical protein